MSKLKWIVLIIILVIIIVNLFSFNYINDNINDINKKYAENKIFPEKNQGLMRMKTNQLKMIFDSYKIITLNHSKEEALFNIQFKTISLSEKLIELQKLEAEINFFNPDCNAETKTILKEYENTIQLINQLENETEKFKETKRFENEYDALTGLKEKMKENKNYLERVCPNI